MKNKKDKNQEIEAQDTIKPTQDRRKVIKSVAAISGGLAIGESIPDKWHRPIVDAVLLPAHAQTSDELDTDIYDLVLTQGCNPQQETGTKAPSGNCTLTGELNIKEMRIDRIEVTFSGIVSGDTIAAAHLHEGAVGVDGNPVVTLFGAGQPSPYNCTIAPCGGHNLTQAQVDDFIAGNGYINIFTVNFSNGWVRGQFKAIQR